MLLLFLLFCSALGAERSTDQIPNPYTDPTGCNRLNSSWICNPDMVLSNDAANWFDYYVSNLEMDTLHQCGSIKAGYQVASAWIDQMRLNSGESSESGAERFAKTLFDTWGVGRRDCNNGVLMFVSIEDRKMHIRTGDGAAKNLSEAEIQDVISTMRPNMKSMNYDQALEDGAKTIGDYLHGDKRIEPTDWNEVGKIIGIILGSICGLVSCCSGGFAVNNYFEEREKTRREEAARVEKEKFKTKLNRVKTQHDNSKKGNGRFADKECPICLEEWSYLQENKENFEKEILNCGHMFCADCLADWYATKAPKTDIKGNDLVGSDDEPRKCPICRQPDVEREERASSPPPKKKKTGKNNTNVDLLEQETRFRMGSLHYMFPTYIALNSANNWRCRDGFTTGYNGYWCSAYHPTPVYNHNIRSFGGSSSSTSTYKAPSSYSRGTSNYGSSYRSSSISSHSSSSSSSFGGGGMSSFGGGFSSGGGGGGW